MEHLQNPFSASRHMLSDEFEICYFDDIYYKNTENHEHDYYELFFFLEGSVNMRIDGNPYPLSPGDVLLIPPLISHHAVNLQPEKSCRCFVLWIRRDYLHRLQKESPCYAFFLSLQRTAGTTVFITISLPLIPFSPKSFVCLRKCILSVSANQKRSLCA